MGQRLLINGYFKGGDQVKPGYIIGDRENGLITEVNFASKYEGDFQGESFDYNEAYIIEEGDFNAHSHPEQSIYTDIVDKSWDLGTWCRNTIYKYSTELKPEHIYLGCCRAFSRMLALGVTSVMVSFYCHNNKGNEYDREVIRAAEDTGIRLYFGRMTYDIINEDAYEAKQNSQKCYFETPEEGEGNFIELFKEINSKRILVAPSVHSIHASTKEAIVRAINLGNKYDRYVQFHLSEDNGDVELSLKLYGLRPIAFLSSLVESGQVESLERVILSDCVWIDEKERELIRKHGMKVVLNPRMNDRVKAGQADLPKFISMDIIPYLGTDGEASNDDLSVTGEREYLKKKYGKDLENIIGNLGKAPLKLGEGYVGSLKVGSFCDIKVLKDGSVVDVFVGGCQVIKDGELTTMDTAKDIEKPLTEKIGQIIAF